MKPLFIPLPGNEPIAKQLASHLDGDMGHLDLHNFPDGECLPRFLDDLAGRSVVLVCTLARPNGKLLSLLFAADAARDLGAASVGLVAPYLCYMRQDMRFRPGEAVTSRSFARLVSGCVDWLVTVDPHLHRYRSLQEIYAIPSQVVHAAPAIAAWVQQNVDRPFLIGPDQESRQWIEAVAKTCRAPWTVFQKIRTGDRAIRELADTVQLPDDCTPVLIDDVIATGATTGQALRILRKRVHAAAVVVATHYLADEQIGHDFIRAGNRVVMSNTVPNAFVGMDVTPLLAQGILRSMGSHAISRSNPRPRESRSC